MFFTKHEARDTRYETMPYILNTKKDIEEMLGCIGVSSASQLYAHLPEEIRINNSLDICAGLSEYELRRTLNYAAQKNITIDKFNSFLGAGCYDHYIPSAVSAIISNSEFLTAYTPYQPESSQGILQAIYEYQSYICLLTGMDVSNASVFDGASSLAEAVIMALRVTGKKKIIVSQVVHPQYLSVLKTYLCGFDFALEEVKVNSDGFIDIESLKSAVNNDTACFAFQSPNFLGMIEDAESFISFLKERNILTVMAVNPMSLALLKSPGQLGVDIVCGEGQPLGGSLNFGGACFGFLAARKSYLRQMPGRIVGRTRDTQGNPAYCLTLQTREQHIKREKATSNICSNQSLYTIAAAVYLSLMGNNGFKAAALYCLNLTNYLYDKLLGIDKVKVRFGRRMFNEFVWQVDNAEEIIVKLYKRKIIAGFYLGDDFPQYKNSILTCCSEKKTREDIDSFVQALREIL